MTNGFPAGFIDELKAKNDIVSVVSRYVTLERKGRTYWGRCPFHGEKTPSFAVNENDQFYHCFGCHAGGDVIKFVQEIETMDFMGAINLLAEWAHMEVPALSNTDNSAIEKRKQQKERLLAVMKDTAKYYHSNLSLPVAKPARDYLAKRKVMPEVANKFGMGYSLGYNELPVYLASKGYTENEMLDAGVVKRNPSGKLYDVVAGRLVFPVIDVYGNVIAFCGRLLDAEAAFAKYLNTAETMLFSKGKTLFGINLVKKKKQTSPIDYLIVVEGHMDVVSLHKAGFDTAVASMGTALTEDQAKLMKRFSDKIYICYDGDSAGKKATLRGLDILKNNGLEVKVVSLPEGLDPDDVINKYGASGYQKCLDRALPLVEFKLKYLQKLYDVSTHDGKAKYLEESILVLKSLSDVEAEVYLDLVSSISDSNKDFIRRQLSKETLDKPQVSTLTKLAAEREVTPLDSGREKAEKYILSCMVHAKPFVNANQDISKLFSSTRQEFYEFLHSALQLTQTGTSLVQKFYNEFSDELSEEASEIVNYLLIGGNEEFDSTVYNDCVWRLAKEYYEKQIEELSKQVKTEIEPSKRRAIAEKINDYLIKIRNKKVDIV